MRSKQSLERGYAMKELMLVAMAVVLIVFVVIPHFFPPGGGRSRASRAKSEMRNLSVALEAYRIDHNRYPPAVDEHGKIIPYAGDGSVVSSGYSPVLLTTPIVYVVTLPTDPFHSYDPPRYKGVFTRKTEITMPYRYATNGVRCWIFVSCGPDRDEDMAIEEYPSNEHAACDLKRFLSQYGKGTAVEYDATNGTASSGDVLRVGP